jgi:diaminohydroxyphosphoribosylaminopyrimidine deaminase/5-amino-6-(5-phosphoribosylamino)uracil reductase
MTTDRPTAADSTLMRRALDLAARGTALAHPNPRVGALITRGHQKIAEGFHVYDQLDHAEIVALKQAGEKARGATMYVTLEPCCTTGRSGPCTKAIIAAGISRVVAAIHDPNPKVAGRGFDELRAAGIEVQTGVNELHARELNESFAKWIRTRLPFVTLKSALTLDGEISSRPGKSTPITGPVAREAVQRLRHSADAIVTGIGTVLVDDPLLTDRTGEPRRRKLLRVVIDSKLRTPPKSRLVKSAEADVLIFTTQPVDSAKARALAKVGAEIVRTRARNRLGHVCLDTVLAELGRREILHVLFEAGAALNGSALAMDIVDKLVLFYAPRLMGSDGVPFAQAPAGKSIANLPPLKNLTIEKVGEDLKVQGYLHDVYGNHRSHRKN